MARKYIKFTKQDINILKNFITFPLDTTLDIKKGYKRFECDIPNKTIFLGTKNIIDKQENNLFKIWLKNNVSGNNFTNKELTFIRILHEVGHFRTFNQKEFEERNEQENMITFLYEQGIISYKELAETYWNIPCEKKATQWAVDFYLKNRKYLENVIRIINLKNF